MEEIASKIPFVNSTTYYLDQPVNDHRIPGVFLCLLSGTLTLRAQGKDYRMEKADVFYLSPETSYSLIPSQPCTLLYLEFHPYFLLKSLGIGYRALSYWSQEHSAEDNRHITHHLAAITAAGLSGSDSGNCQILACSYDFLSHFAAGLSQPAPSKSATKTEMKLSQYRQYMESHFFASISLKDAADHLGYTPQYLSNVLKKNQNPTFQEYLVHLRMTAAILLVRFSSEPDNRVAALTGFPNTAAFLKAFISHYGLSPRDYRTAHSSDRTSDSSAGLVPITNHSQILDFLYNYLHYTPQTTPFQEQVRFQEERVNLSRFSPLSKNWNRVINLGPVKTFENPAFRSTLKTMQERLHFTYGRCLGLFYFVAAQTRQGQTVYDFSKLFEIIDFMRSIELLPFFELGNKPFEIYNANAYADVGHKTFLDPLSYDTFFFHIFPAFIRAAISRYGFAYFNSWKFELWRNGAPDMNSLEPASHYLERFQKTARILKSFTPHVALGGPGHNTSMKPSHFSEILQAFRQAEHKPDFLSAYCFPYTSANPESTQVTDFVLATGKDHMKQEISKLKKAMTDAGMEEIPLYITEYSAFLSHSNYINDSSYPALFILQQYSENFKQADVLAYWLASDLPLRYQNHSYPFFGGNGLFSRDQIPKAGFFAFDFLNRLGSNYVSGGDHYLVARTNGNSFQVLCFYPSKINKSFAEESRNQEPFYSPYSAFEQSLPLELSVHISNIAPGTYLIREMAIGQDSGNILKAWRQLNYWKELGPQEIQYLSSQSVPSLKMKTENLDENYCLQTRLDSNEAKLFTFDFRI